MRCLEHAGSHAARAVAPRGGFRAAGRSPMAMPLTSLAGGQAGQGCNRLNRQAGSDAQSADFTSWFGLASQGSRLARQLRRPSPCARRRPGSLPSSDPGSLGPGRHSVRRPGYPASGGAALALRARRSVSRSALRAIRPAPRSALRSRSRTCRRLFQAASRARGPGPVLPAQPGHRRRTMAAKAIRSKTAASQHMTQHSQADQPQSRVIMVRG